MWNSGREMGTAVPRHQRVGKSAKTTWNNVPNPVPALEARPRVAFCCVLCIIDCIANARMQHMYKHPASTR